MALRGSGVRVPPAPPLTAFSSFPFPPLRVSCVHLAVGEKALKGPFRRTQASLATFCNHSLSRVNCGDCCGNSSGASLDLSATSVKALRDVGRYSDGGGLHLFISARGRKRWAQRITVDGRRRDIGLACSSGGRGDGSRQRRHPGLKEGRLGDVLAPGNRPDLLARVRYSPQRLTVIDLRSACSRNRVAACALQPARQHLVRFHAGQRLLVAPVVREFNTHPDGLAVIGCLDRV